jgi:hypothetical protein
MVDEMMLYEMPHQGILKGEVSLYCCLTGLESAVWQLAIVDFIGKTD